MAILRFHIASGVRLAVLGSVPLVGVWVVAIGLSPRPAATLAWLALGLASPSGDPVVALLWGAQSMLLAAWAAPHISHGITGWLRHLPASSGTHRRALALALAAAQAPLSIFWLLAWLAAALYGAEVASVRLFAIPVLAMAAAYAALPVRRRALLMPLVLVAAVCAIVGEWLPLIAGILLLALAEALAGPVRSARRRGRSGGIRWSASALPMAITLRSAGSRLTVVLLVAVLPLIAGRLFLANNDLEPGMESLAVRLSGGFAAALLLAGLGGLVAVRRPPWPWIRSLPWSARRRALLEACTFALPALPLVAVAALPHPSAFLPLLALLPFLSLRTVAAIRRFGDVRTGPAGPLLAESVFLAVWLALVPWLALALLAAAPLALHAAAGAERDMKVSRWSERHHLAAGDPVSWSAR